MATAEAAAVAEAPVASVSTPPVVASSYSEPVRIGVIGGTGLLSLPGFTHIANVNPQTPWGYASAPIQILHHKPAGASTVTPIAFLTRHGVGHQIPPHEVPARANIAALRSLGVRSIIAYSAVGSLAEEIRPRDFVVPDQVIDRTKGVRPFTFFEKGVVGHVAFGEPFDTPLRDIVRRVAVRAAAAGDVFDAPTALPAAPSVQPASSLSRTPTVHAAGTVICMEGPQFSTRAESRMYRAWGAHLINMTVLPEAKLAREAELAYAMVCMATDYDSWHDDVVVDNAAIDATGANAAPREEDVTVAAVLAHMAANGVAARRLLGHLLDELVKPESADIVEAKHLEGSGRGGVVSAGAADALASMDSSSAKSTAADATAIEKLRWLFYGGL